MAIGERIRFFRNLRGMTQKMLGISVGYPETCADVRIAQYEHGTRGPKDELIRKLAEALEVSTSALSVPNIESIDGIMHTFFVFEDLYGLQIDEKEGQIVLSFNEKRANEELQASFRKWLEMWLKWRLGDISKDDYDAWRYNFTLSKE